MTKYRGRSEGMRRSSRCSASRIPAPAGWWERPARSWSTEPERPRRQLRRRSIRTPDAIARSRPLRLRTWGLGASGFPCWDGACRDTICRVLSFYRRYKNYWTVPLGASATLARDRQRESKRRADGRVLGPEPPAMRLDEAARDRQPHADALGLGREERLEDAGERTGGRAPAPLWATCPPHRS